MNRAFTLIELLIVIAIIGILAGAITVTLSDETGTAENARIKLEVSSAIPKLTIAYVNGEKDKLCDKTSANENDNITKMNKPSGTLPNAWTSTSGETTTVGNIDCLSIGWTWAIAGRLKVEQDGGEYWCVDEDGYRGAATGFEHKADKVRCKQVP